MPLETDTDNFGDMPRCVCGMVLPTAPTVCPACNRNVVPPPTEQPQDRGGRLVLNAYGRRCYDAGRDAAKAEVAMLRASLRAADDRATMREEERDRVLAQLPEGMKHCTIVFKECDKGHGWLTATNWVDHGCPTCERLTILVGAGELTVERAIMRESQRVFLMDLNRAFGYTVGGPMAPCELIEEARRQHEKAWMYDNLCK